MQNTKSIKPVWIPQVIAILMLLWALYPGNPYGYYVLLRWICCGVFLYLCIEAGSRNNAGLAWVAGITAGVYNPIWRVHLNRDIWSVLNIITILFAVVSVVMMYPRTKNNQLQAKFIKVDEENCNI